MKLTRREMLQGAGALVVSFGVSQTAGAQGAAPGKFDTLDGWLSVGGDGRVTAACGKVELGTGTRTALAQLIADELDVPFERVTLVMGDTEVCPDQGATTGSRSVIGAGPQLRRAAAEARQALIQMAGVRWSVDPSRLTASGGTVQETAQETVQETAQGAVQGSGGRRLTYAELVGSKRFNLALGKSAKLKPPGELKVVGKPIPRVELPGKIFGGHVFVQNLRIPGMVHGRVIRPPLVGATVERVDEGSLRSLPGNVRLVTKGNFVAVVADREEDAVRGAAAADVKWKPGPALPDMEKMPGVLQGATSDAKTLASSGNVQSALSSAAKTLAVEYYVPFHMHGSIWPSCAVADVKADRASVWSATQSSFQTRDCIAGLLGMPPDRVHLMWVEGSGCYGHNAADDVSGDAALLSQWVGKPVRVQWMRHDEHCYEPKGVPMAFRLRGGLDAQGNVAAWDNQVWSTTHSARPLPGAPGNLVVGNELGLAKKSREVGADRNARHSYEFPNNQVTLHFLHSAALRVSALRGLGSPQNSFANESFMDELAAAAHADPLAFRIKHLKDDRAIAVLEAVRELSRWDTRASPKAARGDGVGRGVAFVQYENDGAYVAIVARVRVDRTSGKARVEHVAVAHDCGLCVNPDGMKNQIEGNVIQGISRATLEQVTFDRSQVTSVNWASYPILRFSDVPDDIAIALIQRPDKPSTGGGEPAIAPMFGAIGNAIHDATGLRLRSIPFTPEKIKAALA
jgi:CO/xanthine dehydrogenase Mo-binding subunit